MGEAENVINEEKHILTLSISEMLSDSQPCKSNTSTSTRRLIHLTIHKSTLAFILIFKRMLSRKVRHTVDNKPSKGGKGGGIPCIRFYEEWH